MCGVVGDGARNVWGCVIAQGTGEKGENKHGSGVAVSPPDLLVHKTDANDPKTREGRKERDRGKENKTRKEKEPKPPTQFVFLASFSFAGLLGCTTATTAPSPGSRARPPASLYFSPPIPSLILILTRARRRRRIEMGEGKDPERKPSAPRNLV